VLYTKRNSRITAQRTNWKTTYFRYDNDGELISLNWQGAEYFYLRNLQGDVIGLVDENGSLVVEYAYDAWGKPLSITGELAETLGEANPFRYRSYYWDDETGLYYLQSRYYDPEVGRFINADEPETMMLRIEDLLITDLFIYCSNTPVMNEDPTGHIDNLLKELNKILPTILAMQKLLRYNEVYKSISDKKIKNKSEFDKMSEVNVLARIIYAEDTQSESGQKAVAWCIKNRKSKSQRKFYHSNYGNNFKGVCLKANAFEPAMKIPNDVKNPSGSKWKHAKELAARMMMNLSISKPAGCVGQLYFYSSYGWAKVSRKYKGKMQYKMDGDWKNIKDIKQIGGNTFFNLV
jgi:RHS repeat-associated protein